MKYTFKELSRTKDKVEYEVTVDFIELETIKEEVIVELAPTVKIDGFRAGKVPREKVEERLGSRIYSEGLGRLLPRVAYEIMQRQDDRPVQAPEYDIQKTNPDDGIVFTFSFVNYPEVTLGDFTKLKVKKTVEPVTDEDVDTVIKSIVRSSLPPQRIRELTEVVEETPKKKTIKKTKDNPGESKSEEPVSTEEEVPEPVIQEFTLNDALIEALGYDEEKGLESTRTSVRERLEQIKEEQSESTYISKVIEAAVKASKFDIPQIFIDNEVNLFEDQFNARLEELKLDRDTYLATQGIDIEKKREEWQKQAVEKVSADLVLINLANEHNDVASEEDIDAEIAKITNPHVRNHYKTGKAREYVWSVITRQKGVSKLMEMVKE